VTRRAILLGTCAVAIVLALCGLAQAASGPLYDVKASWGPTNLPPGGVGQFELQVRNIGDEVAEQPLFISDELPPGVTATAISWRNALGTEKLEKWCSGVGTELVSCIVPGASTPKVAPPPSLKETNSGLINPKPSGYALPIFVEVAIAPSASGTATNRATVGGGGAAEEISDVDQVPFSALPAPFDVVAGSFRADVFKGPFPDKSVSRKAGDHPFEERLKFDFTTKGGSSPVDSTFVTSANGSIRTVETLLPRGMIGNPEALQKCKPLKFAQQGVTANSTLCPANTQVGYVNVSAAVGGGNHGNGQQEVSPDASAAFSRIPLYSLEPPAGTPVDLAFSAAGLITAHIFATLDPAHDYAVEGIVPDTSTALDVHGVEAVLWGVPGDPAHDKFRYYTEPTEGNALGAPFAAPIKPLFTNPMDCGFENGGQKISIDSYEHPGEFTPIQEDENSLDVEGCDDPRFRFEPEISLQPTDRHAGAPTGLAVHLEVPQRDGEVDEAKKLYAENGNVNGISTPPVKRAVVTLPEGMTLSPSAAQGLDTCSLAQIGLGNNEPVRCPDSAQFGTLTLHTPILPVDAQPEGRIYVAKQSENPFGTLLGLYLVVEDTDLGILVKLPGRIDVDRQTGQITTTFDDVPQFPVSDLQLNLKSGVRAGLVEPSTCGKKTIRAEFFSWQDPATAHVVESSYKIEENPSGSPCVDNLGERPFGPQLEAGTANNRAGSYSPFVFRLTRTDEDQELSRIGVTLPPGLAAKLAGVGQCPDAAIAQAEGRREPGEGALEQLAPSCPASSLVGSTEVGSGVGVPLTWVPGKIYLAGPYRGAPLSIVVISPAVVGPFDLGVVVLRTAIEVAPETAQVSATSDALPQIIQGIPVRIRDARLNLDRPNFMLNPTSCAEKRIDAHVAGTGADVNASADDPSIDLFNRFQAADCASLGFAPKLSFRLFGGTHRGAHPRLQAVLKMRPGGANIGGTQVALPSSEFVDNEHFDTICTRVQFSAHQCPAGSVYGFAVAKTPLFGFPLEGPVYLRSAPGRKLPDIVAALRGPASMPIEIDLDGHVDSVLGRLRATFESVPDAPVNEFALRMAGGKKGLIQNSTNLCAKRYRAIVKFKAQNGLRRTVRPPVAASCGTHRHRSR
jgi:hypothetical protein